MNDDLHGRLIDYAVQNTPASSPERGLLIAAALQLGREHDERTRRIPEFAVTEDALLARFQGGSIVLRYHGCGRCGNAFWTEDDERRRLTAGLHHCPHCGDLSRVPEPPA